MPLPSMHPTRMTTKKGSATDDANKRSFPECPTNQSRTVHHDRQVVRQRGVPKFGGESTRMPRALGCATASEGWKMIYLTRKYCRLGEKVELKSPVYSFNLGRREFY